MSPDTIGTVILTILLIAVEVKIHTVGHIQAGISRGRKGPRG